MEGEYKTGQIAFYHESGEVDKVEILENNSDKDWIKYKLRVIENIQESSMVNPMKPGEEFECKSKRGESDMGLGWHLLDH